MEWIRLLGIILLLMSIATLICNILAIKNIHDIFKRNSLNMSWIDRLINRNFNR